MKKTIKTLKVLDLTKQELSIVKEILKNHPNAIIFGSRIKGTRKKFSDLDICLKKKIKDSEHELLREAFENSDLPFKVDIILYDEVRDSFKKIIDNQGIKFSKLI